eukprot:4975020-Amphidinium_carterae.1
MYYNSCWHGTGERAIPAFAKHWRCAVWPSDTEKRNQHVEFGAGCVQAVKRNVAQCQIRNVNKNATKYH